MSPRWRSWLNRAVLVLLLAQAAWGLFYIYRTSIGLDDGTRTFLLWDDAMVSMRYAYNLTEGDGLVWNRMSSPYLVATLGK